jgi:hypothetical protein
VIRLTSAPVMHGEVGSRAHRCQVGSALEQRAPSRWVTWYRPTPAWVGPLKSPLRVDADLGGGFDEDIRQRVVVAQVGHASGPSPPCSASAPRVLPSARLK